MRLVTKPRHCKRSSCAYYSTTRTQRDATRTAAARSRCSRAASPARSNISSQGRLVADTARIDDNTDSTTADKGLRRTDSGGRNHLKDKNIQVEGFVRHHLKPTCEGRQGGRRTTSSRTLGFNQAVGTYIGVYSALLIVWYPRTRFERLK